MLLETPELKLKFIDWFLTLRNSGMTDYQYFLDSVTAQKSPLAGLDGTLMWNDAKVVHLLLCAGRNDLIKRLT
jgi:hypothetical protein